MVVPYFIAALETIVPDRLDWYYLTQVLDQLSCNLHLLVSLFVLFDFSLEVSRILSEVFVV